MNENKHISDLDLLAFSQNTMDKKDVEALLEHICSCNFCSDQLAAMMAGEMITAPRDLKDNILKATKRPEIQLAIKAKETSKRMQLFLYSLKVGTATIGALLLLVLTMNFSNFSNTGYEPKDFYNSSEDKISMTTTIKNVMDNISNSMLDFSNNIIKTEVTKNDQKEK
ncbi:MAG: hypothetical protein K0S01_354 [Herbinix sp.]|jgi:hypothetical protein|nr:hypothetical protein [Herbinix sp.]